MQRKVAPVTGASKGRGRAITDEFAQDGAWVSIGARGERALADAAAALKRYGFRVIATSAAVNRVEDTQQVIDATIKAFGRLDILITNAGDIAVGRMVAAAVEQWRETMEVNLLSALRFTQAVVPDRHTQGGGRIINVSSVFGRTMSSAGSIDYHTSKAALRSFARRAAVELAGENILVNSVCPGWIEAPMLDRLLESAKPIVGGPSRAGIVRTFQQLLLIKRMGRGEEVAAPVVFLASERASYSTGRVYDVDGGFVKSI